MEAPGNIRYLLRASKTQLEVFAPSTGLWSSISGTAFTGDDTNFFDFANVTESKFITITNGFDKIRKWDGSGNASALGGNPANAKYQAYLTPYLLIANLIEAGDEKPWKVNWCDTASPEVWTGGNSGAALITDEPSSIQNLKKLNEFAAIYKKESLVLGRKVDPPDVFLFETIKSGVGLSAPRAVADAEGVHYFQGFNDFYQWNGPSVQSIGAAIRDQAFELMDPNFYERGFALHVKALDEIWFFVVNVGSTWPENIWKYKYKLGYWYEDTCDEITAALAWERAATLAWNDAAGTWNSQQTLWNSSTIIEAREEIMFGNADGYALKLDHTTTNDNGVAVSCSQETLDFVGDDLENSERWLQFDAWLSGPGKVYIDYSDDFGSNWINIPYTSSQAWADTTSLVAKYEWYFDVWAPQIRFRIRNAELGEGLQIESYAPYFLKREEIRAYR